MNNESAPKEKELAAISLLKTFEDMLDSRIKQKHEETHKTQNIAESDKLLKEIDTVHWVITQNLSIRRLLTGQESKLIYDTTATKVLGQSLQH